MRIDVCVASCRRPSGLRRLLASLEELLLPDPEPELRIVVVDNDPEGSARPVCAEAREWLSHPLEYRLEPRRGIPQARNAALAVALPRADWIAFLDDDETPEPGWLAELLAVAEQHRGDIVTGPVIARFEEPPAQWLAACFARPRMPTGTLRSAAYTGNVLVRADVLAQQPRLFDERMALLGGSDAELFSRLHRKGHSIVWADVARVWEWVPAERASLTWLARRAFRVGAAQGFIRHNCVEPPVPLWIGVAHGAWCLLKGALLLLLAALRGRVAAVAAAQLALTGAGQIFGAAGLRFDAYERVEGS